MLKESVTDDRCWGERKVRRGKGEMLKTEMLKTEK